ncbi:MAG: type II toxin-antitoxin system prevent-host-death family antitoxin [Ilumatobacteraceae bacterium]
MAVVGSMEVGVTELRGQLSALLDRVRDGDEIVVTERGLRSPSSPPT